MTTTTHYQSFKKVMEDMIKWLMKFKVWKVSELRVGAEVMEIASTPLDTINKSMESLLPLLDSVGSKTQTTNELNNYGYDDALRTLQTIMSSMIKWIGDTFSQWDMESLKTGTEVLSLASEPMETINSAFSELLTLARWYRKENEITSLELVTITMKNPWE